MKSLWAYSLLLFAAMAWGSGFAVTKGALEQLPPYLIMATPVMLPFVYRRLRAAPRRVWIIGLPIGLFVFLGHLFQFLGMQYITAGKSAFLSAVYVVLVPFIVWGLRGARPSGRHVAVSAVCSLPAVLLTDWQTTVLAPQGMLSAAYLAVVCSALAFSAQYTGLKNTPSAVATILLSLESVFGCLTGVLFLHETVSGRMLVGCVIILVSLLLGSMPDKIQLKNIFIRR